MKLVDFVRQLTKIMVENQLSEKDIEINLLDADYEDHPNNYDFIDEVKLSNNHIIIVHNTLYDTE